MAMQQRAILTQAKVLAAAAEVFARVGFAAATLNDITAEAETTKGALYFHFESKEALADAIIADYFAQLPPMIEAVTEQSPNALVAVVGLTYEAGTRFREDPIFRAGMRLAVERAVVKGEMPHEFEGWVASIASLLTDARKQRLLRKGIKPEQAASVLASAFFGVQHVSDMLSERKDLEARLDEFWKMFLIALAADPDWTTVQRQARKVVAQVH
jgi:AcrR family transcriptional regulator